MLCTLAACSDNNKQNPSASKQNNGPEVSDKPGDAGPDKTPDTTPEPDTTPNTPDTGPDTGPDTDPEDGNAHNEDPDAELAAVDVIVFDDFVWYEGEQPHGERVFEVVQGLHNSDLFLPDSINFHKRSLNESTFASELETISIYSRSISTTLLSNNIADSVAQISQLEQAPLVVSSAGNGANDCTQEAAAIGRDTGLSGYQLEQIMVKSDPRIERLYKACDMYAVSAIDTHKDSNWIVIGNQTGIGQHPGRVLMHRWVGAPYIFDFNGESLQGTSYGTPYVSAIAAEIVAKLPQITATQVANLIFSTATDLGAPGVDPVWGHGNVNLPAIRQRIKDIKSGKVQFSDSASVADPLAPRPVEVDVVVFDSFDEKHGEQVLSVAQGLLTPVSQPSSNVPALNVPATAYFHRRSLSEHTYHAELNTIAIYNRSFSTHKLDDDVKQDIQEIAALSDAPSIAPLVVTSAGNGNNTCTTQAAEVGRTQGLSSSDLNYGKDDEHPDIDTLYKACDMHTVGAIDNNSADNWIIVGSQEGNGQKPGSVLMNHWINAPYVFNYKNSTIQGTSFASPYITAIAAEIVVQLPNLSASEVAEIIFSTATDMGEPGVDPVWGHGIVNLTAIRQEVAARQ